jgi:predicted nuclease with TOPRIM domain
MKILRKYYGRFTSDTNIIRDRQKALEEQMKKLEDKFSKLNKKYSMIKYGK